MFPSRNHSTILHPAPSNGRYPASLLPSLTDRRNCRPYGCTAFQVQLNLAGKKKHYALAECNSFILVAFRIVLRLIMSLRFVRGAERFAHGFVPADVRETRSRDEMFEQAVRLQVPLHFPHPHEAPTNAQHPSKNLPHVMQQTPSPAFCISSPALAGSTIIVTKANSESPSCLVLRTDFSGKTWSLHVPQIRVQE